MAIEPRVYWSSEAGRRIANLLPEHSRIRQDESSVGYKFLDMAAGVSVDSLIREIDRGFQDSFLTLASQDAADSYYELEFPSTVNDVHPENTVNLLANSSFDIRSDQSWFADDWFWNSTGTVDVVTGKSGGYGLTMSAGSQVYQDLTVDYAKGTVFSFLCWTKSTSGSVEVTLTYDDGSTTVSTVSLGTVSAYWEKVTGTVTADGRVVSMRFQLEGLATVDDVLLRRGTGTENWRPSIFDSHRWITLDPAFLPYVHVVGDVKPSFVGMDVDPLALHQWWYSPPTRTTFLSSTVAAQRQTLGYFWTGHFIDSGGDEYPMSWKVSGGLLQRFSQTVGDIYANYDLRFWTPDGQFDVAGHIIIDMSGFRDQLCVLISKDDWAGVTRYYLAFCSLNIPYQPTTTTIPYLDYLEARSVVELPGLANPVALYFPSESTEFVAVYDSGSEHLFRLHYDYYMLSSSRFSAILRHSISNPLLLYERFSG